MKKILLIAVLFGFTINIEDRETVDNYFKGENKYETLDNILEYAISYAAVNNIPLKAMYLDSVYNHHTFEIQIETEENTNKL